MTPASQPQEYIITEEQIVKIGEAMTKWYLPDAGISLCRLLRSLPTPSRAEQCPELSPVNTPDGVEWLCNKEAIRKEAAAQAREELFEEIKVEYDPVTESVDWDSIEAAYIRCTEATHDPTPQPTDER